MEKMASLELEKLASLEALKHKSTPKIKKRATPDTKFKCKECDSIFACRSGLRRHMMRHSGQYAKYCDVCGKGFLDNTSYQNHYNRHTGFKLYMCNICTKSFTSKYNLARHNEICQANHSDNPKQFPCVGCNKVFPIQRYLDEHISRYHGKHFVNFPCEGCGRNFQYRSSLSYHRAYGKCSGRVDSSESQAAANTDEVLVKGDPDTMDQDEEEAKTTETEQTPDFKITLNPQHENSEKE